MSKTTKMTLRVAYTLSMGLFAVVHFVDGVNYKSVDDLYIGFWMAMLVLVFWLHWTTSDHLKEANDLLNDVWMYVYDVYSDDTEQLEEAERRILERFNKEGL